MRRGGPPPTTQRFEPYRQSWGGPPPGSRGPHAPPPHAPYHSNLPLMGQPPPQLIPPPLMMHQGGVGGVAGPGGYPPPAAASAMLPPLAAAGGGGGGGWPAAAPHLSYSSGGGGGGGYREGAAGGGGGVGGGRGAGATPSEELHESRRVQEEPSRTLFIRNIEYRVSEKALRDLFGRFGDLKRVFELIEKRGMAFVAFYDIRSAEKAKNELQDYALNGRPIHVHYSLPKDERDHDAKEDNNDTLFLRVRGARDVVSKRLLRELLEQWGDIKEIRDCRGNPRQKFVEFYDIRDAERTRREANGKSFAGGTLAIEFAHSPGNKRTDRDRDDRDSLDRRTEDDYRDGGSRHRGGGPMRTEDRYGRGIFIVIVVVITKHTQQTKIKVIVIVKNQEIPDTLLTNGRMIRATTRKPINLALLFLPNPMPVPLLGLLSCNRPWASSLVYLSNKRSCGQQSDKINHHNNSNNKPNHHCSNPYNNY
ncbi:nuclear localization sequence binding protein, variant 2 [Balamuthia mandrillaris]